MPTEAVRSGRDKQFVKSQDIYNVGILSVYRQVSEVCISNAAGTRKK